MRIDCFFQVPTDGVVYILARSLPGESNVDFTYFADLVTTVTQTATPGQPINGTLNSRLDGKAYKFTVSQPTWLRVGNTSSDSTILVLKMADGSLRSSPEGFFGLVLAGDYEVGIYNDARSTNTFSMTIDLLSQVPAIPINQTTTINKSGRYRVDVNAAGRFELQLQNTNGGSLQANELLITDLNGTEISFDPRGTLGAGSYWVTFRSASTLPAGDYRLQFAAITSSESKLAIDVLGEYSLNASGLQEHIVTVQLTPGMRLLIDELELGSSGRAEVRFNRDIDDEWTSVDLLESILLGVTGKETLQFRISGTGLVRVHVVDLNAAVQLPLGSTSIDLDARRRGQAWSIGGNVGDILDIINDSKTERPALWLIVDEAGRIITQAVNEPVSIGIVNRQRLSLVLVATEPLTATLKVLFRTVIS